MLLVRAIRGSAERSEYHRLDDIEERVESGERGRTGRLVVA